MTQTLDLETEVKPSMEFEGGIMTADSLVEFWPKICEQLDRIPLFWGTRWTKESLHEAVMVGRYQVWGFGKPGSVNVIVFTEVVDYPANRILRIPLIFGNSLDQMLPIMEATMINKYAQEAGCSYCEAVGRAGWERKVPRFKRVGVLLRCEVKRKRMH